MERLPATAVPDYGAGDHDAIGAEHIGRRPAAPAVVLRRLLALDYVLEHAEGAWLPTEDEKVCALATVGIDVNGH